MTDAIQEFFWQLASGGLSLAITLVRIAITLAIAWFVSRFARRKVEPMMSRRSFGRNGALLVGRLLSVAAFLIALFVILAHLGANWTGILAIFSAFTVAIGLSLQDVMKNFFSGIILLMERPFQVGDRIKVRDVEGEIQGIDIRTTLIRNTEGSLVHVPNSVMFSEILTNKSHYQTRRLDLIITSVSKPIEEIEKLIVDSLNEVEGVRKPIPAPTIHKSSTSGTQMEISILIEARSVVQEKVMRALIEQLGDSQIEIAE